MEVATKVTPRRNNPSKSAREYHRVGNVGDEELIEAQHTALSRDALGHELERLLRDP